MSGIVSDNQGRSSGLVKSTTVAEYDDDKVQSNIALLGFKTAVNGSLAKYNLQDQIIDEYEDATGIDAGNSTNETLTSGAYYGGTALTITGGSTAVDGDYTVHTFTTDANFVTDGPVTVDYLMVGGGGGGAQGGGGSGGGGGGAGAYISATSQSLSAATHAAVIGTGGAQDVDGGDTTFNSVTAGGGGAGGGASQAGNAGRATDGSGGGAGSRGASPGAGNGNGNAGGDGDNIDPGQDAGGGGGGSAAVGGDSRGQNAGGHGGAGTSNSITGSAVYYGAGGGGGCESGSDSGDGGSSLGGDGGHGSQNGQDATGYGNGGGGNGHNTNYPTGGDGSNGIVIVRRLTAATTSGGDLTLQSTDTTAMAEPDYADMVILMENAAGTATINTDIKGYISKDSGSTFTEGTLVDEGTWGTNKKIYAFHDLDISAQSGTSMCYKITTHNQSAGSLVTKIHATSIGWKA